MSEEQHVDLDYFADVDFDLSLPEIVTVLERIDGRTDPYEAGGDEATLQYNWSASEESADEIDDENFEETEFVPVSEASPPADGDLMVTQLTVEYDIPADSDTYAPADTFVVWFTNDGFEIFTQEHYLRTSPTELFELLKPELEAGP